MSERMWEPRPVFFGLWRARGLRGAPAGLRGVLIREFKENPLVTIVSKGLAEKSGTLDLSICTEANTISTFAREWKTGRFAKYKWDKVLSVPVTTLDELVRIHGPPSIARSMWRVLRFRCSKA